MECTDFDLCDTCFQKGDHSPAHVFVRVPIPLDRTELSTILTGFQGAHHHMLAEMGDSFDHIIYVVNGTISAPPTRYTGQKMSKMPDRGMNVKLSRFVPGYPLNAYMSKVTIVGNYPNDDYKCMIYDV